MSESQEERWARLWHAAMNTLRLHQLEGDSAPEPYEETLRSELDEAWRFFDVDEQIIVRAINAGLDVLKDAEPSPIPSLVHRHVMAPDDNGVYVSTTACGIVRTHEHAVTHDRPLVTCEMCLQTY